MMCFAFLGRRAQSPVREVKHCINGLERSPTMGLVP